LSLFAAGAALLALLFASYSRRSTWLALGSTAMSMAALVGLLFVMTSPDQSQVRTRLAWLGSKLPLVLNGQVPDDLITAFEHLLTPSSCDASRRPGCRTVASAEPPPAVASTEPPAVASTEPPAVASAEPPAVASVEPPATASAEPPAVRREAMQAAATTGWLESKPESKSTSPSPVRWLLGDQHGQASSSSAEGFSISGTNVSDQALEQVHAVLKPDASQREVSLALNVDGHKSEAGAVIPAGARFSLVSEIPNGDGLKQFGGAILSFRYIQAGQRKTSILYLTPSMVARFANRG
jgi:hypothetical protein